MGKGWKKRPAAPDKQQSGVNSRSWVMASLSALFFATLCGLLGAAVSEFAGKGGQPRLYTFTIKATYPHDPNAFTQGLEYDQLCTAPSNCTDVLWESTGMNGESEVRLVDLITGTVLRQKKLENADFGEGMVKAGDRLLQLTWRTNKVFSYAADNFDDVRALQSPLKDGWGITHTGGHGTDLVISDGSSMLTLVDPETLAFKSSIQVTDGDRPVRYLNELEFIKGDVWANVWQTECIARIDLGTGKVKGWVMLHGLLHKLRKKNRAQLKPMDVLNGIAWDKARNRLFVTGKYWPSLFQIILRPHPQRNNPETLEQARRSCLV